MLMLKDITIIDFQGYTEVNANKINYSARVQKPNVEYILLKGEFIYPTLDLVFNSSDGNSYYIE
jgi:hypothetical protein